MKTYTQHLKKKPFDWNVFLNDCIKNKIDLYKEESNKTNWYRKVYLKASKLSSNWVTCAVGNQCAILDRDDFDGEPKDDFLRHCGQEFDYEIGVGDWKGAKQTLKEIEKQSSKLIKKKLDFFKSIGYKLVKM